MSYATDVTEQVRTYVRQRGPHKKCKTCGVNKDAEKFYTSSSARDGRKNQCIECYLSRQRDKTARAKLANELIERVADLEASKTPEELVIAYWNAGQDEYMIANRVPGVTPNRVLDIVGEVRASALKPSFREVERQKALIRLDQIREQAMVKGDLKEARLAVVDTLKAVGVVQQGGAAMTFNFNQQNNVLGDRLDAWMERQNLVEGEVVEDKPALPPAT